MIPKTGGQGKPTIKAITPEKLKKDIQRAEQFKALLEKERDVLKKKIANPTTDPLDCVRYEQRLWELENSSIPSRERYLEELRAKYSQDLKTFLANNQHKA